ncbi:MAG: hypothetical protein AAGC81_07480 [Pseudomonadota bacterium]
MAEEIKATPRRIPRVGTPAAEKFIEELEARVASMEKTLEEQMVGLDEITEYANKKGLNSLTSKLANEAGSDRVFTKKPEAVMKKKKKKKRVRMAL